MFDDCSYEHYLYELGHSELAAITLKGRPEEDLDAPALFSLSEAWAAAARTCATAVALTQRLRTITRDVVCGAVFNNLRVVPVSAEPPARPQAVTSAPTAESDWGFFIGIDPEDDNELHKHLGRRRPSVDISRPLFR